MTLIPKPVREKIFWMDAIAEEATTNSLVEYQNHLDEQYAWCLNNKAGPYQDWSDIWNELSIFQITLFCRN